jgi:CrcB protein
MILLGGGIGSLARFAVATAITKRMGAGFPLGTIFINVTGSFLTGLLMTLLAERFNPPANVRLLLVVGFLGGYTTFSAFEWETLALAREDGGWLAALNVLGSVLLGYAAVWLGMLAAGKR